MKEVSEDKEDDGEGSDISGYHSDSESAVMTSGNSPFISKEARYSFLSRSGKLTCFTFFMRKKFGSKNVCGTLNLY